MKCPMCLGKGYATDEDIKEYPHRCPNCNGKGFYSVDWQKVRCEVCNGSGKKPQTNEEWLRQANTEQLAEVLNKIFMTRTFCHICPEGGVCDIGYECKYHGGNIKDFVEWLKEKHSE